MTRKTSPPRHGSQAPIGSRAGEPEGGRKGREAGRPPLVKHQQRKAQDIEAVMQNLRRMVKALQIYAASVEREYGITGPQLWALWELGRSGPLALKDLSERMYLGGSTVVGVLDRLEARGLAERLQDAEDRRRVSIRLTPEGAKLLATAPHPAHGQLLHALQDMSAARVAELREATDSLVHAMEADDLEARFFFSET